jgi:hypothetical protein
MLIDNDAGFINPAYGLLRPTDCKSDEMGVSPRYAIPKALAQAGLTIDDIDIYEVNEALSPDGVCNPVRIFM